MSPAALLLASLLLVDPSGDVHGAGDLTRPTAAVYSSSAPFDLVEVEVLEGSTLTLRVRLAERPNPGELANGITLPVIDLYVDSEEGGREELLPGPGLRMPPEGGWEVAIRVTGDTAFARRAADDAEVDHPVTVTPDGDALVIATPFEAPERTPRVHALTGVYDAFDADAWRPLTRAPSPWAFSSETARFPVVDLLAEDDAAQQAALTSGVLPQGRGADPVAPWLVLMVLGLVIAFVGLLLRSRVGRVPADAPVAMDADDAAAGPGAGRAHDEDPKGTRAYDVDTDHAAPLWSFGAAEDADDEDGAEAAPGGAASDVGLDAAGPSSRTSRAGASSAARERGAREAKAATTDGSYDEAMLGPLAAEPAEAGHAGHADADDEGATAVLRESDLFDPVPAAPRDPVVESADDGAHDPAPSDGEPRASDPVAPDGEDEDDPDEDDPRGDDASPPHALSSPERDGR